MTARPTTVTATVRSNKPVNDTVANATYPEQAARLVASVDQDPWGSVRPSLYESARVISAAPWLPGEPRRVAYLLNEQAPDGSWGEGPERYRLLPTLSAVEAALALLRRGAAPEETTRRLTTAVDSGLAALRALPSAGPWPDTAAAEILVPSLVAKIHEQLTLIGDDRTPAAGDWRPGPAPALPGGYDQAVPGYVARRYASAGSLPVKLHHTFEGVAGYIPGALIPDGPDLLGSSPAATAARAAASDKPRPGSSPPSKPWRSATRVSSPRRPRSSSSNACGSPPRWPAPICRPPVCPPSAHGPPISTTPGEYAAHPDS